VPPVEAPLVLIGRGEGRRVVSRYRRGGRRGLRVGMPAAKAEQIEKGRDGARPWHGNGDFGCGRFVQHGLGDNQAARLPRLPFSTCASAIGYVNPKYITGKFSWRLWRDVRSFSAVQGGVQLDQRGESGGLSDDGGHIENLAAYSLLKRRCKVIVAINAEADPTMSFGALMILERYARMISAQPSICPGRRSALSKKVNALRRVSSRGRLRVAHQSIGSGRMDDRLWRRLRKPRMAEGIGLRVPIKP